MPEFLSDEWLAALDASARAMGPLPAVAPFVLEQVVSASGREDVRYQLVFAPEGLRVRTGGAEAPDVSFATDLDTAASIARGETNAQRALASGRLRVARQHRVVGGAARPRWSRSKTCSRRSERTPPTGSLEE